MADTAGGSGDIVGASVLEVGADGTNFEAAIGRMKKSAEGFERDVVDSAGKADAAVSGIGKGGAAAAQQLDRVTRNIIGSIERTIAAFQGGERGTARFFEALGNQRGANTEVLRPYLDQLRAVEAQQDEVARSLAAKTAQERAAAAAAAELTRAQAQQQQAQQSFLASLREQIALTGKSADEQLRVRAAQLGIGSAASPLILQLQNQRAAQEQAAQAAREEADAQRQAAAAKKSAEAAGSAFINQLREQVLLQDKSQADVLRVRADRLGVGPEAEKLIAQLRGISGATRDARAEANLAKNAFRQLPAQFTDIFTSLQGGQNPFTVLIQQGGQIKDSFGGIGPAFRGLLTFIGPTALAIGGVGAALGVVAVAAHKGSEELLAYERALILSGNAAGATAGQLNAQAKTISASVGTQGKAAEVLTALAAGGNIGSAALGKMAEAAIRLERAGGPAVEKTVDAFNELAKSPLQATLKLNEGTNFLTRTLYDQIKALEDQGRTAEAARVAQEAFANASLSMAEKLETKLGSLQRAWRGVAGFAKGAWDAMLNVGRPDTLEETIEKAEKALSRLDKAPRRGGTRAEVVAAGGAGPVRDDLSGQVDSMKEMLRLQSRAATLDGERAAQGKAQAAAGKLIEDSLTRQQKLAIELAKADATLRAAGRGGLAESPAVEAAIRKRFEEPAAKRDAFGPMLRDIEDLIRANEQRVAGGRELTKAEELEISLNNKLADSLKSLSTSQQTVLRAAIDRAVASQRTRDAQVEEQKASEVALKAIEKEAAARAAARKKEDDGIDDFIQKQREAANAQVKSIADRTAGLLAEGQALALSRAQNIDLAAAIELVAIARLQDRLGRLEPGSDAYKDVEREIAARKELAQALGQTAARKELDEFLDPDKAKSFGDALTDAFDGAGNALVRLSNIFSDYAQKQTELQKKLAKSEQIEDPAERLEYQNRLIARQGELQIDTYASMAGAAKGFFDVHSRGYKTLQAVETTFRAFQLASDLVKGVSAAAVGVANQAQGDPYTAFPRMAAMAAAMAGLGFATGFLGKSGGGVNASAEQRQSGAATGRVITADQLDTNSVTLVLGTVLGDSDAKSESIQNALEMIADSADLALDYQSGMLDALRSIDASLAGLGNLVVRTSAGGITTGKNLGIEEFSRPYQDKIGNAIPNAIGDKLTSGFLGAIDKIVGPLFGKTTQEIADSGLSILGSIATLSAGQGVQQFADVKTTESSFFGLRKKTSEDTVFASVDEQIAAQFGLVFESIADTLLQTAGVLGKDATQFNAAIQAFVVDIPRLSLKDLKGDELQDAINAAIGAAADSLSLTVLPGLADFQTIGEGYFETLIKVASGIETANYQLELLGLTAIDYTQVLRKQGDVGAEIVRQSIQAAETAAGVLSSVGQLIGGVDGSASDIAETYDRLVDVRDVLGAVGIAGDALTSSLLRGAGGLDALADAADAYFDNFFSDTERSAVATALLAREFAALGLELPGTRDEFRALVDVIGKDATESGQKLLGKVLGLAEAFDDVAGAAEKAAEDLVEAIREGMSRFGSDEEKRIAAIQPIRAELRGAGVNDAFAESLIGASRDQILGLARAFIALGTESDAAKAAVFNASSALFDLRDKAAKQSGSLEIELLRAQGRGMEAVRLERANEIAALTNLEASLGVARGSFSTLQESIYKAADAASLLSGLDGVISDFLSGGDLAEFRAARIQTTLAGGGIKVPIDKIIGATTEDIIELWNAVGDAGKQAILDSYSALTQLQTDLTKEQRKSLEDQIAGMKGLRDLAKDIAQFTASLKFSDLSPLSAEAQIAQAQALFETTLTKARDGDTTAQGALLSNAQAYLEELSAAFASGPNFTREFDRVTAVLDQLGLEGAALDPQIKLLEDIFGNDRKVLDTLIEIRDTLKLPEPAATAAPDPSTGQRYGLPDASEGGLQQVSAATRATEASPEAVALLQKQVDRLTDAVTALNALATISQVAARDNKAGLEEVRKPLQEIADQGRLVRDRN